MHEVACQDGRLLEFAGLSAEARLVHAFTMKPWNLAPHRGQDRKRAVERRRAICEMLGVSFDRLTSPQQVHGAEILRVEKEDIGRGRLGRPEAVPFVDGLLTDRPGVPLILLSADCPLVLVFDSLHPAVGIVHASWLGTVAGITSRLVERMTTEFLSNPRTLRAAIAPSAGACCYEVGPEVRRIFRTRMADADQFFTPRGEKYLLDLHAANVAQLVAAGVPSHRIEVAGACTICDSRFWSHRRDGPDAGRNALIAALR
jgi:YfiH family protein